MSPPVWRADCTRRDALRYALGRNHRRGGETLSIEGGIRGNQQRLTCPKCGKVFFAWRPDELPGQKIKCYFCRHEFADEAALRQPPAPLPAPAPPPPSEPAAAPAAPAAAPPAGTPEPEPAS